MMQLAHCPACGRHELPPESDQPPSLAMRDVLPELLRFAHEFDEMDPDASYQALDFVDWVAGAVGRQLREVERETRQAGQYRRRGVLEVVPAPS